MSASSQVRNLDYASTIADTLQRAVGHYKKPWAIVVERTGRSVGAAKNWLAGTNGPAGAELIELCREFDEVWDAVCELAGRTPPAALTESQRAAAEHALRILTGGR